MSLAGGSEGSGLGWFGMEGSPLAALRAPAGRLLYNRSVSAGLGICAGLGWGVGLAASLSREVFL